MIWLIWLASGMRGGNQVNVLSLNHPAGGIGIMWTLAALIWVLTFPMSFLIKEPVGGFQIVGLRSVIPNEAWLQSYFPIAKFISFVVAAPLVEEFMFRGFLLSALETWLLGCRIGDERTLGVDALFLPVACFSDDICTGAFSELRRPENRERVDHRHWARAL
jgi:hypothetical protein